MSKEIEEIVDLNEKGIAEVVQVVESIKVQFKKAAEEAISEIYTDIHDYIDTDTWMNYRANIRSAMEGHLVSDTLTNEFAKDVRDAIFKEHRSELIAALNQDLRREIVSLKRQLDFVHERATKY